RALLLSRPLLDHLCFHELCHLRHMDHSAAYRAELSRLSPDWARLERGLSRAWRELPWWALPRDGAPAA
ncbi:MAG: M48 family metallopeptidase, partial [Desulfovibrio sp.]|nr:M48 family metallopeptidase [Desulfovibrio sp.]